METLKKSEIKFWLSGVDKNDYYLRRISKTEYHLIAYRVGGELSNAIYYGLNLHYAVKDISPSLLGPRTYQIFPDYTSKER